MPQPQELVLAIQYGRYKNLEMCYSFGLGLRGSQYIIVSFVKTTHKTFENLAWRKSSF